MAASPSTSPGAIRDRPSKFASIIDLQPRSPATFQYEGHRWSQPRLFHSRQAVPNRQGNVRPAGKSQFSPTNVDEMTCRDVASENVRKPRESFTLPCLMMKPRGRVLAHSPRSA